MGLTDTLRKQLEKKFMKGVEMRLNRIGHSLPDKELEMVDFALESPVVYRGGKILAKIYEAREDEAGYIEIDPSHFFLPPAPFADGVISLAERSDLVMAAFLAVRTYAERQEPSKSTHINVKKAFRVLAKTFEFAWLRGYYSLQDWSPELTDSLPKLLGEGGWAKALNISERVSKLIEGDPKNLAEKYIGQRRTKADEYSIRGRLQIDLGTNIMQAELDSVRDVLSEAMGQPLTGSSPSSRRVRSAATSGMLVSALREQLAWINLLAEAGSGQLITYAPYPSPVKTAEEYGRGNSGRTPNITPTQVAKLLAEGLRLSEEASVHILALLEDVVVRMEGDALNGQGVSRKSALAALESSAHRLRLRDAFGMDITGLMPTQATPKEQSLDGALETLYSGCFALIGLMNARRKDEVQHRKIGLTRASLEVVDKSLDLYMCSFYMQKTHKLHVPMYVGRATVNAIHCLEHLESLTMRLALAVGGEDRVLADSDRALFRQPNLQFGTKRAHSRVWFEFGTGRTTEGFFKRAFGEFAEFDRITSHMFRRGYGLLFIYRFEGPILALTQKYGHLDPTDTITYLVDPRQGGGGPKVNQFARMSPEQIQESINEVQGIEREIRSVSDERLQEMVRQLVDGKNVGGGAFPKLIRRLHQRFSLRTDYGNMEPDKQGSVVADLLKSRGHQFRPYWHGNCCAPSEALAKRAHCNNKEGRGTRRENAGPIICAGCQYHHIVADHIRSLEGYALSIRARLVDAESSALARARLTPVLENLERVVVLHRRRMEHAN